MRQLPRFAFRCLLLNVVLLAVVAASGWSVLRGSLPKYEGTASAPGLLAPVTLERDALGTLTVHAGSRRDVGWALGYAHAQERFFQMDLMRRRAAGELAELFGPRAVPVDRRARMHRMRAREQQALTGLPDGQRASIDAYRDGVNAGLAALRVRPFPYVLTRTSPTPWRSEDTLLAGAAMAFTLNDEENTRELALARMHAALPAAAYAFLTAGGGEWDAPLAGDPLAWPRMPSAGELDLRTVDPSLLETPDTASAGVRHGGTIGSNSFAVAGSLTGGAALVADDMHLDLGVPSLWFRARLLYPDPRDPARTIDVTGATLPGTPVVVVGSNGQVAWGFTNSYADTADWVRVRKDPADPARYLTNDGPQPLRHFSETLRVNGAADETIAIEETRWGPILASDVDGTPLALAWTAQQPGAIDLGIADMELARTAGEAVAIAQSSGLPPQNLIVGDRHGAIAWTIAGRLPRRVGSFDPLLPADWSIADTGWDGWLSPADHPLVTTPPGQRLWSANQRAVEGTALAPLGDGGYDLGARAGQIREGLQARAAFTPADLLAIQLDDRALFLSRWKALLERALAGAPPTALREAMQQVLGDWDGHASIHSVAYRLVRAWRAEVVDRVLGGFAAAVRVDFPDFELPRLPQAEHAVWALLQARPAHLLPPGVADWDALLLSAADAAGGELDARPGGLAARTWGERNTSHIAHPLSGGLPSPFAHWLDMPPMELPGDSNMPRVQAPDFGASERFGVAPGDESNGYFMMSGGQSGHPLSPYYGSGHADWAAGRPTPFLPGPAEKVLVLEPSP